MEWFREQPTALLQYDSASGKLVENEHPRAQTVLNWLTEYLLPAAATGDAHLTGTRTAARAQLFKRTARDVDVDVDVDSEAAALARIAGRFAVHMFGSSAWHAGLTPAAAAAAQRHLYTRALRAIHRGARGGRDARFPALEELVSDNAAPAAEVH